jgi:hypothetical protein
MLCFCKLMKICHALAQEPVASINTGEDESTLADHLAVMKSQLAKQRPNMAVVNERMNRTLDHRRELIHSSTVIVVLESSPGLGLEDQASYEEVTAFAFLFS